MYTCILVMRKWKCKITTLSNFVNYSCENTLSSCHNIFNSVNINEFCEVICQKIYFLLNNNNWKLTSLKMEFEEMDVSKDSAIKAFPR
jgi:hypothetical protein